MAGPKQAVALQRYLERYIEPDLPTPPAAGRWRYVLVIPAYRESPELLTKLGDLPTDASSVLVILVLNRPDSDDNRRANRELRDAVHALPARSPTDAAKLFRLNENTDILLLDLEVNKGPSPADQGVGLARKFGCDLALSWIAAGAIETPWIYSTDADATLPADYFCRLEGIEGIEAAAVVFPFQHAAGDDASCNSATALYELRLHHYVLGLEYAGSPYAYHSLGSCLAVSARAYAEIRGFPRRSGGEDFYLLNKAGKTGAIARLTGASISLQARLSDRVPFGTGPAATAIASQKDAEAAAVFYHPAVFVALRAVLLAAGAVAAQDYKDIGSALPQYCPDQALAQTVREICKAMSFDHALKHCRRQASDCSQFMRHFHQWFDGFRTLKLIHAVTEAGYPRQNLKDLRQWQPDLWPGTGEALPVTEQLQAIYSHWHWHWSAE